MEQVPNSALPIDTIQLGDVNIAIRSGEALPPLADTVIVTNGEESMDLPGSLITEFIKDAREAEEAFQDGTTRPISDFNI